MPNPLLVLSSYKLSRANNARIARAVESLGGTFIPTNFDDTLEEIVDRIEGDIAEATIFLGGRLTEEQWGRAKRLEWIHVPWAGVNSLMGVPGIAQSRMPITNSSGVMADSVADQVMAYLLLLNRSLPKQLRSQEKREWNRYTTVEHPDRRVLRGMTVGILGYGAIGQAVAIRAKAFGMKVLALKRSLPKEGPNASALPVDAFYTFEDLGALLAQGDFVVIALPLTPQTDGLIGLSQLQQMKPTAYIVNIARGNIIREEEMIAALDAGIIAGAALDVFAQEPLPEGSMLWGMENVILTPHSAGGFVGFGDAVTDLFLENLSRFVRGEEMRNRVDVARGY